MTKREAPQLRILLAILALGVVLRTWQYLGDPSLWIDEFALGRQILERPMLDLLFRPLDYHQAAPSGLLALIKVVTAVVGDGEFALRLVPFVAGLASLPTFLALANRILPPLAQAPAMFFFAVAPNLILRGAEVKQYSTDVLLATAVVLLALRWLERPTRGSRVWEASGDTAAASPVIAGFADWGERPGHAIVANGRYFIEWPSTLMGVDRFPADVGHQRNLGNDPALAGDTMWARARFDSLAAVVRRTRDRWSESR